MGIGQRSLQESVLHVTRDSYFSLGLRPSAAYGGKGEEEGDDVSFHICLIFLRLGHNKGCPSFEWIV